MYNIQQEPVILLSFQYREFCTLKLLEPKYAKIFYLLPYYTGHSICVPIPPYAHIRKHFYHSFYTNASSIIFISLVIFMSA